jgi:hypothetical protein
MAYFLLLMSHDESPDQTIISVAVLFIAEHAIFCAQHSLLRGFDRHCSASVLITIRLSVSKRC